MRNGFVQFGIFNENDLKYGVEINSAPGKENVTIVLNNNQFTFNASSVDKLNNLI